MTKKFSLYRLGIKRGLDILVSGMLLLLLSPLLIVLFWLIRRNMGSPVLFRQPRGGKDGRVFMLNKFRSMRDAVNAQGEPLPDADRLTPLGTTLRKLSLDELPQLWNVFCGDMSLIGPRPLLVEYLERYSPEQARRHEVLPGITGWAQVNGRNAITWEEKFAFDVWYVDHISFWLDTRIAWRTVLRVIRPADVNAEGFATMPKFMGTDPPAASSPEVEQS